MPLWLQNPYILVVVALGAMFFGYFFGLFEGRGQGYKRRKAEETEEDEAVGEAEAPPPDSPPLPPDETSVLNVSLGEDGQLHLNLDGKRVEASAVDAEQRKRMIAVLTQIRPWLEAQAPAAAPPPAQPRPASSPQSAPPAGEMSPTPPKPPSKPAAPPAPKNEEESATEPQSIVAQIDSILQMQLVGTPLEERGVRLLESPEGGVVVWVGLEKYEGIDDVPDDQIKSVIRKAINAWELKYTPGL
jgi:hypothetical protein